MTSVCQDPMLSWPLIVRTPCFHDLWWSGPHVIMTSGGQDPMLAWPLMVMTPCYHDLWWSVPHYVMTYVWWSGPHIFMTPCCHVLLLSWPHVVMSFCCHDPHIFMTPCCHVLLLSWPPPLFQRGGQRVRDRRHGVHSSGLPSTQVSYTLDYILFFKLKTIENLVQHLVFLNICFVFVFRIEWRRENNAVLPTGGIIYR